MTLQRSNWLAALAAFFLFVNCSSMRIQKREDSTECYAKLTGLRGTIESPNFPDIYPPNQNCKWIIETPQFGDVLYLEFSHFDLEAGRGESCPFDALKITEGVNDIPHSEIGVFCGSVLPQQIVSTQPQVFLQFRSDRYFGKTGFQIEWSVNEPPSGNDSSVSWTTESTDSYAMRTTSNPHSDRCYGIFAGLSGVINSPNYPGHYPENTVCEWVIDVPEMYELILNVQHFDLGWRGYSSDCIYEYLEIRDGPDKTSPLIGKYCSPTIPRQITNPGNQVYLNFKTGRTTTGQGFSIQWESRERDAAAIQDKPHHNAENCGGEYFYSPTGNITSPNYPQTYPPNTVCEWIIEVPANHQVVLDFEKLLTESSEDCLVDYLEIRNGSSRLSPLIGRYCGLFAPEPITSDESTIFLRFRSDSFNQGRGFSLKWRSIEIDAPEWEVFSIPPGNLRANELSVLDTSVNAANVCGGYFNSSSGIITSPNYPDNYPENTICEWIIEAPDQHQVTLNVGKFNVAWQAECTLDFLQIRNGGSKTSPVLGKYCGTNVPSQITSSGNRLYLKFRTDSSTDGEGFYIEWDSIAVGCGGNFTTASGSISSPNYPQPYRNLADCSWDIKVSAGSIIEFMIVDLDLDPYNQCQSDLVEIYDGSNAQGRALARYCRNEHPSYAKTTSNVASIRYRNSNRYAGRGFHMSYHTLCRNKLSGFHGVIESPNFPIKYPHSVNCSWIIEVPTGHTVNLTFSHLHLEGGRDDLCPYDYVEIKVGADDHPNSLIGKFCDSTSSLPSIMSTERQVFVQFYSDGSLASQGFQLEWNIDGSDSR